MTEPQHVIDTDTSETAEEFLRKISGGATGAPGGRRGAGAAARRPAGVRPARGGAARRTRPAGLPSGRGPRPWRSASASLLVPGGGQWMNGQRALALLFLSLQALAVALAYFFHGTWESLVRLGWVFFVEETTLAAAVFFLAALAPALWVLSVLHAYGGAARLPNAWAYSGPGSVAVLASILVPGWGQLLNDQLGKAALFLTAWAAGAYVVAASLLRPEFWAGFDPTDRVFAALPLTLVQVSALALAGLLWVLSAYDAFLTARHR